MFMNILKLKSCVIVIIASAFTIWGIGCRKMDRPAMGNYLKDANVPGGPLKFYAAFDGTSSNPLMNAVDSTRANFPSSNPLTSVPGISGNAVKGVPGKAINYASANDFKDASSFTISMWLKSGGVPKAAIGTQFIFSLVQKNFSWHNSALFLYFDHDGAGATVDSASMTLAIKDNWFGFYGNNRLPKLHDLQWHHLVFVYDETVSKLSVYVDGNAISTSGAASSQSGINGPVNFKAADISNLVIGGWNAQAGLSGPTDSWVNSFAGTIDQFRLYSKALNASDITALYLSKL